MPAEREKALLFPTEKGTFGIPLDQVLEIVPPRPLLKIAGLKQPLIGVTRYSGGVFPIVNLDLVLKTNLGRESYLILCDNNIGFLTFFPLTKLKISEENYIPIHPVL